MIRTALMFILTLVLSACGSGGGNSNSDRANDGLQTGPMRVLVFSRTQGFRHSSIEAGQLAIQQLGMENDFSTVVTEDPDQFNDANLADFDVVVFLNTTGDVLNETQQDAFERYIRNGGGYTGIHSAADTEHDWPFYGELVGAYFLTHPVANQPGTLRIEDTTHPSTRDLPAPWMLPIEEFYSFESNPADAVRVLFNVDESSYRQTPNISCDPRAPDFPQGFSGVMGDHPMSWCHDKFAGRAWYTAIGHELYLYQLPEYRAHILGGILTAGRRVEASCAVRERPEAPAYQPPMLEGCETQIGLPPVVSGN